MKIFLYSNSDTKKFGKGKQRKNHKARRGYSYSKEYRKYIRKMIKQIHHKLMFKIPLSEEETNNLWRVTQVGEGETLLTS